MTGDEFERARSFVAEHGLRGGGTAAVVIAVAFARGIDVSFDERRRARLTFEGKSHIFGGYRASINQRLTERATDQKEVASRILRHRGIRAPESIVFGPGDAKRAWSWAKPLLPVVVKPNDSDQGRGVHVGVRSRRQFARAFDSVASEFAGVLVEEFLSGTEHRVLVVDGKVVAAIRRVPAHVVGDGSHDIAALIERKNAVRRDRDDMVHKPIKIDEVTRDMLSRHGKSLSSVLAVGEVARLRPTSNLHTGGDAVDATDELTADEIDLAERAVGAFRGLRLAGLDMLLPRDGDSDEAAVLEINAWPMLSMHHFPEVGRPRDAAGTVVDAMFPATACR